MKTFTLNFLISLLLICLNCKQVKPYLTLPDFQSNFSLKEDSKLKELSREKDFLVAFGESSIWEMEKSLKVFSVKNGIWEKIEIRSGIVEVDSVLDNAPITMPTNVRGVDTTFIGQSLDWVNKEIYLRKECRKDEAKDFMNKLIEYGLFELPDEPELLEACAKLRPDGNVPEYSDVGDVYFYIIKHSKVRLVNFHTYNRNIDCPGMSEWDKIEKIRKLFLESWYQKEHY